LPDSTRLTELTKDIIKTIVAADHEEKATINPRAKIYIRNITGFVVLLLV
jgi:hypothetical protein